MAKVISAKRLAAIQDHLDEIDSYIHDLKGLLEIIPYRVIYGKLAAEYQFMDRSHRDIARGHVGMIQKLLKIERNK